MSATRRFILRGLAAAPLATLPDLSAAQALTSVDPIFAAIEKHKAAQAAFVAALRPDDGQGPDVEGTSDVEWETRCDMHQTVPQTIPGLLAYVDYWTAYTGPVREGGNGNLEDIGWEALPTIAEALATLFPSA